MVGIGADEKAAVAVERLADIARALGVRALFAERVDGVLVLEVSASERLFGGRAALLRHFYQQNKAVASVQCAQGATSLIALGRLLSALPRSPADALPVGVLAAAQHHHLSRVALGGGCFANRTLLAALLPRLQQAGLAVYHPDINIVDVNIKATVNEGTTHIGIDFNAAPTAAVPVETEVIFGA